MNTRFTVLTDPCGDARLKPNRHTDSFLPITRFSSREQVEARRKELQFNLRMAAGLYPWPEKNPLNPKYELVGEFEGYTLYKVMFESRPGFWSTGNLYLPRPLGEKHPAIFHVIGHWELQRLTRSDTADYPQYIANCARMGFICLVTDMVGKVDSRQVSHKYGRDEHRMRNEKELWCSNSLGIQLWNNIRGLDLLCAIPQVDADNIGMTGASGGGSQTLFCALVDDRVKAAAPINMISLHMQGGCECENAAGLRISTDNAEMCAMLAPRPLFLAGSTGDWTKYQQTVEYPAVLEAYRQYGAEHMVEQYYQIAPHQYNEKTRRHAYRFFARHLMGKDICWEEQPIHDDDVWDLTWFRGQGQAPGYRNDEEFFAGHKQERTAQVSALPPEEKKRMLQWITGVHDRCPVTADPICQTFPDADVEKNVVTSDHYEQIPYVVLKPKGWDGKRMCLALGGSGKECVEKDRVQAMLAQGTAVLSGDLFMTGEMNGADFQIQGGGLAEWYFNTFHYTRDAYQVQDVALLWKIAAAQAEECFLWADGCAARAAACALPLLPGVRQAELEKAALDLKGDEAYFENWFVPGILLLGGFEGCLAMAECPVTLF